MHVTFFLRTSFKISVTCSGDTTIGQVQESISEFIKSGLESEDYDYEFDANLSGMIPYFGEAWETFPEDMKMHEIDDAADAVVDEDTGETYVIGICDSWEDDEGWDDDENEDAITGEMKQVNYFKELDFGGDDFVEMEIEMVDAEDEE
eukprot:g3368.t1